jgi:hypothetical protein
MGDTGSMYLGASVAAIGLATHQHLTMILVALVYILEALSVMIQVTYFKYTKKKYGEGRRIFKMTPIHHHFEMSGFSEYKIVITFSVRCDRRTVRTAAGDPISGRTKGGCIWQNQKLPEQKRRCGSAFRCGSAMCGTAKWIWRSFSS